VIDEVEAIVTVQPQYNEIVVAVPGPAGEGIPGGGLTLEQCMDAIATMLVAGANVTLDYVDGSDTLTISSADGGLTTEQIQDMLSTFLVAGANISLGYNDAGDQLTVAVTGLGEAATLSNADIDERARDAVAAALVAGTNITIVTNDVDNTITISASGSPGGSSIEVQDEGASLTTAATRLNFTGYGVQAIEPSADQINVVIPGIAPRGSVGNFYWPTMTGDILSFGTYQRLYFVPFVGNGMTITQALVQVDTAGASGEVRLGLYDDGSTGALNLIQDFGVATATTTGFKSAPPVSRVLTLGTVYTLAVCIQGNSAVKVRGGNVVASVQSRLSVFGSPNPTAVYYQDSVTGALPATSFAPYGGIVTGQCPWVQVFGT
jgi:hypothetical protein